MRRVKSKPPEFAAGDYVILPSCVVWRCGDPMERWEVSEVIQVFPDLVMTGPQHLGRGWHRAFLARYTGKRRSCCGYAMRCAHEIIRVGSQASLLEHMKATRAQIDKAYEHLLAMRKELDEANIAATRVSERLQAEELRFTELVNELYERR